MGCQSFITTQYEKIEQFCLLKSLGFPHRVVCIASGELNDAAVEKYNLKQLNDRKEFDPKAPLLENDSKTCGSRLLRHTWMRRIGMH